MTQGDLLTPAPANIVFTVTKASACLAREIGEEMLRPFGVSLARVEVRARTEVTGTVRAGSLHVTATGEDGMQVARFSARTNWPHDQAALTLLEGLISSEEATWDGDLASYALTLQEAPELPRVFRH